MNAEQLEAKFREDERAGLMLYATEAEAKRIYGRFCAHRGDGRGDESEWRRAAFA